LRPSSLKIQAKLLKFLEPIQGDICGLIQPLSGPFMYFICTRNHTKPFKVTYVVSTRWSHVCLLSTRNHAFAKIIAQVIKLKAEYPEHQIHSLGWIMLLNFSLVPSMIIVWP
jgi:hypothetical protein